MAALPLEVFQLPAFALMTQGHTNPLDAPDLPLFKGEKSDVREEARETFGDEWLKQPNLRLGGRTPDQVINENHGARVRDIIRSAKYIALS